MNKLEVSDEYLAKLYLSTDSKKCKDIIYKKLHTRFAIDSAKICRAFTRTSLEALKFEHLEEYMQLVNLSLHKSLNTFKEYRNCRKCTECLSALYVKKCRKQVREYRYKYSIEDFEPTVDETNEYKSNIRYIESYTASECTSPEPSVLKTHYLAIAKNDLIMKLKTKDKNAGNEICDTRLTTNVFKIVDNSLSSNTENTTDGIILKNILMNYIDMIDFKKDVHKDIFLNMFGLEDGVSIIKSDLAKMYGFTKQAVGKIYSRYLKEFRVILEKNNGMDKLKEFVNYEVEEVDC